MVYICELFLVKYDLNCGACSGSCFTSPFPCLSLIPFYGLLFCHSPYFPYFDFSVLVEKLGCFQENATDPAMGKLLKNLQPFVDLDDMSKTVNKCSEIARSHSQALILVFCYAGNLLEYG